MGVILTSFPVLFSCKLGGEATNLQGKSPEGRGWGDLWATFHDMGYSLVPFPTEPVYGIHFRSNQDLNQSVNCTWDV